VKQRGRVWRLLLYLAAVALLAAPWPARAMGGVSTSWCGMVRSDQGIVVILWPTPGTTLEGQVTILGTASLTGLAYYKVEYSVDCSQWVPVERDFRHAGGVSEAQLAVWDTMVLPNGGYWLRVVAVDASGNYLASIPIAVSVANATPTAAAAETTVPAPTAATTPLPPWLATGPSGTVGISSPRPGATVSGDAAIEGTATNVPLHFAYYKVEYTADGVTWTSVDRPAEHMRVVTEDVLARWDTTAVPDGPYRLRAVVVDKSGNYTVSPEVPVVVGNASAAATAAAVATVTARAPVPTATRAPTATPSPTPCSSVGCSPGAAAITAPAGGSAVRGTVSVEGSATIARFGYYKVEYSANGVDWASVDASYRHGTAVAAGSLATWDTTAQPDGAYRLRVVVVDTTGNYVASLPVAVVVANAAIATVDP
jgi:hypothetical protein